MPTAKERISGGSNIKSRAFTLYLPSRETCKEVKKSGTKMETDWRGLENQTERHGVH